MGKLITQTIDSTRAIRFQVQSADNNILVDQGLFCARTLLVSMERAPLSRICCGAGLRLSGGGDENVLRI
ncbi:MAG TPA: hypothetical protein PL064_14610 [Thermogutta sp.]|nr:hypothetical protein [Thermogutta sp.]